MAKMYGSGDNLSVTSGQVVIYKTTPAVADTDGIKDGAALSGTAATTVACNYKLDVPRQISCTTGGTAASIKADKAVVYGIDPQGNEISEELTAFTVDEASTKQTAQSFAFVEKVVVPAMDGAGATLDVGWTKELWLPLLAGDNPLVLASWLDGSAEASAATISADATNINKSYIIANGHASFDGEKEFAARLTCE